MMEEIKWSTWAVPERLAKNYILLVFSVLYILPYLFGLRLTVLGFVVNYFWIDYMFFRWYKNKKITEEYFKENDRQRKWRRDNGEDDD